MATWQKKTVRFLPASHQHSPPQHSTLQRNVRKQLATIPGHKKIQLRDLQETNIPTDTRDIPHIHRSHLLAHKQDEDDQTD